MAAESALQRPTINISASAFVPQGNLRLDISGEWRGGWVRGRTRVLAVAAL